MKCQNRIFVNTYIPISITFPRVSTADIQDLYVKFVHENDPTINKQYLLSDGDIQIDGDTITVEVLKGDIAVPGRYEIHMRRTDQSGNELGVNACPSWVIFYQLL